MYGNENNNMTITGYVTNVQTRSNTLYFSIGMGVKQQDGTFKNGFMNCKTTVGKFNIVKGQRIRVNGFLTFEFWNKNGKNNQKTIVFVQNSTLIEEAKNNTNYNQNQATQQQYVPKNEPVEELNMGQRNNTFVPEQQSNEVEFYSDEDKANYVF